MKFIHTADLHLDSPFRGLVDIPKNIWQRVHQSTFTAFERIVDDAIKEKVDFVLIVGDIYDRDNHSAEAEDFFVNQCERLNQADIPVYLSYGNHDYQLVSQESSSLPENVHVFGNQVETKKLTLTNHQVVGITGFSYEKRWLTEDRAAEFPERENVDWWIGMLHGAIKQNDPRQDHYAPFTIDELIAKKYDYWALGHIHKPEKLNEEPSIIYPGVPQGRHKNESGEHGYYLVESEHGHKLISHFKVVAPIEWEELTVTLSGDESAEELVTKLKDHVKTTNRFKMLAFNLENGDNLPALTTQLINNGTLLDHLQDSLNAAGDPQWWPYQLDLIESHHLPKVTDLDHQYWEEAEADVFTTTTVLQLADKLTKYDFITEELADPALIKELRDKANLKLGGK